MRRSQRRTGARAGRAGGDPGIGRIGAALAIALALGCATTEPPESAEDRTVLVGMDARAVVVLPLNVTAALPEPLEGRTAVLWRELTTYLGDQGVPLKTVSHDAARKLWLESIQKVRASQGPRAGFDEAARVFVVELAKFAEFDRVLFPTVFVQSATIDGRTVVWDGVERQLAIDEKRWAGRVPEDLYLEGLAPATSLHVVVVDGRGSKIHEGQAGLDLLVDAEMLGDPERTLALPTYEFVPRPTPFPDPDHVREGVARSLAPLLPVMLTRSGGDG